MAQHLVHGMGMALEEAAWPAITADEATAVLGHFPAAGRVIGLRWHSPRPFSAAALVDTVGAEFFLKRHHRSVRTPGALAQEHAFIAHLDRAGLPVPQVMATTDGASAIAQGDWTYELHRTAPGHDLYRDRQSWTPFLTQAHAFQAGVALARLHVAAHGFAADGSARDAQPLVASFSILPAPDPLTAAAAYITARPALAAFLAGKPWRQELARLFATLGQGLAARLQDQPPLWTHNDWHPSNLLWATKDTGGTGSTGDTVRTVFDFGLAAQTCALHDVATAIERSTIPWLQGPDAAPDVTAALAIIAGYRTVCPLDDADLATIVDLLPLVHVEFALSEIAYFAGILDDAGQAAQAWDDYLVGHADWFAGPAGQTFLRQLAQGSAA